MDDIISHGDASPPGGWRRRAALAAALLIVVTLLVVEHLGHGGATAVRGPALAGKTHVQSRKTGAGPAGLVGPAQPWADATRLPRTGTQPAWFSPANGTVEPIRGLPKYSSGYVFTRVDGGWALQPRPAGPGTCGDCHGLASSTHAGCGSCPGAPVVVYYLGDRTRTVTAVGVATMVAAAAASGSVWLTTFPAGFGLGSSAGIAREYDSSGRARGPAVRLPVGYKIVQATSKGLLLTPLADQGRSGADRLWNPVTRRVIGVFARVIATRANELAFTARCTASCPVHVLDLVTGSEVTLKVTQGEAATGEFSPDGRYLALGVDFGIGRGLDTQLDVASLATGQVVAVPHAWSGSNTFDSFGWPGDGDDLVAKLIFGTSVQVTFWNAISSAGAVAYVGQRLDPDALVTG
jgi:hypothetical protein